MHDVLIYHNPRCSKSRQTLALLREQGIEPNVVEYLHTPPSEARLAELTQALRCSPRQLMRTNEPSYRELGLQDASLSDAQLIAAMHANPVLIQRPIVVTPRGVALGRPPENVLTILDV